MRLENETCPEIECLKDSEFSLDPQEQKKQESLMEQEVIQVTQIQMRTQSFVNTKKLLTEMSSKARQEIQLEIVRNQYLYDILRGECWDSMKVKGKALKVRD